MSPNPWLLFCLLLVAIAAGWWLGRRQGKGWFRNKPLPVSESLSFLLKDQADAAIESFIQSLDVRPATLEIHLALGTLLRRRGEVDRAIRIHQNILERKGLEAAQCAMVQLELGRDYAAAGWLDRAERMFQTVLPAGGPFEEVALQQLLEVYDCSHEWEKAIATGERWLSLQRVGQFQGREKLATAMSHYFCELAAIEQSAGRIAAMQPHLEQASRFAPGSLRVCRLQVQMALGLGDTGKALKVFRKHVLEYPASLPELLDVAERVFRSRAAWMDCLQEGLSRGFSVRVLNALAQALIAEGRQEEALALVTEQVRRYPGLQGVRALLGLHLPLASGQAQEHLQVLSVLLERLIQNRPVYHCSECGFHGQYLHWQCPGCKAWGSVNRIQGIEGD